MTDVPEIITLQFGDAANQAGAHFWNAQRARISDPNSVADPRCLYEERPGQRHLATTAEARWIPRLLLFDLEGGTSSDPQVMKALYASTNPQGRATSGLHSAQTTWHGPTQTWGDPSSFDQPAGLGQGSSAAAPPKSTGPYHWTQSYRGMLRRESARFFKCGYDDNHELQGYRQGSEVFKDHGREMEAAEDSLRLMAERCDYLQGFHVVVDAETGFGGVSASFLQSVIADEFGGRPVVSWCLTSPQATAGRQLRYDEDRRHRRGCERAALNSMLTLESLEEHSSMVYLCEQDTVVAEKWLMGHELPIDSMALAAQLPVALLWDSSTLHYRLRSEVVISHGSGQFGTMSDNGHHLSGGGNRRLASASVMVPADSFIFTNAQGAQTEDDDWIASQDYGVWQSLSMAYDDRNGTLYNHPVDEEEMQKLRDKWPSVVNMHGFTTPAWNGQRLLDTVFRKESRRDDESSSSPRDYQREVAEHRLMQSQKCLTHSLSSGFPSMPTALQPVALPQKGMLVDQSLAMASHLKQDLTMVRYLDACIDTSRCLRYREMMGEGVQGYPADEAEELRERLYGMLEHYRDE
eukprot:Clim_evm3s203 gene=Clim_evmTU3s203